MRRVEYTSNRVCFGKPWQFENFDGVLVWYVLEYVNIGVSSGGVGVSGLFSGLVCTYMLFGDLWYDSVTHRSPRRLLVSVLQRWVLHATASIQLK